MVIKMHLSNFFSIRDEITIDFRAANIKSANIKSLPQNVFKINKYELLKTLIIFGANASGKSNIIKAIRFCVLMILNSHNHNENTKFNFQPFLLDGSRHNQSNFRINFLINAIEYEYSFSFTVDKIIEESLYFYPKGKRKLIFKRDERLGEDKKSKYIFGEDLKRPLDVALNTSNKTLFLSRASQMDRDIAKEIFNFFANNFLLGYIYFNVEEIVEKVNSNKQFIIEALKNADLDIIDINAKLINQPTKNIKADLVTMTLSIEEVVSRFITITTKHQSNPNVTFDFITQESQGTIEMFFIILTLMEIQKQGKILLIDEIENSLHPLIVEYIFDFFKHSQNSQLLCTTHNTFFLDTKKFRKDQLFFTNKKNNGSTELYSLVDFKDFRDTMDAEKAYLQGRFEAIPFVRHFFDFLNFDNNG